MNAVLTTDEERKGCGFELNTGERPGGIDFCLLADAERKVRIRPKSMSAFGLNIMDLITVAGYFSLLILNYELKGEN